MSDVSDDEAAATGASGGVRDDVHIHKPRAAHNVREFLSEISVIVVGIAIALTGEQAIESLDWARKVSETRQAISVELGTDLGQAVQRVRVGDCVERRLDDLAAVVDEAARTGRLPPLGAPERPPFYTWEMGVWQSAVSAQALTHMRSAELKAYTGTYSFIARIETYSQKEDEVWADLYGLAGPGRTFDQAEAASFRRAIGLARFLDRGIRGSGVRAAQLADGRRLPYDRRNFRRYIEDPVASIGICQPIPATPPAHYGAAPWEGTLKWVLAHPIGRTPPDGAGAGD